ncbi:TetR family transcriptional regulator [Mycobacterium alsense]|uniref:TetR family transcriptional regulator n=1 Tax=Mycobacterium alsense TaxID=324058 RepID=A0ABD6P2K6_9MYCO|nr:TetR family transcriptional regulator [Mycobacterium alsense]OBG40944.1 TetR family transcriptional regulator [Mycobacterium alsense]
MTAEVNDKPRGREAQRLETRQRVYAAAIAEFKRSGVADADIGEIVSTAGVARGTFYFHFPTKEHVLDEVERNLVKRLAADLARALESSHDLWSILTEVVRLVVAAEARLGPRLFRDVLALHFSQTRPQGWGKSTDHPLVALVAKDIERAQAAGVVHPDVDAVHSALFFLLGLYSLLVTNHEPKPARTRLLDAFLASTRRGLERQ